MIRSRYHTFPEAPPRIVKVDGRSFGILNYDIDNGYPQRIQTLINACSTAAMACDLFADYIVGQGFKDKAFFGSKINESGLTPDILIRLVAADKSKFKGLAIHVNYNAFFQVDSASWIPFENCRIGIDENEGKICLNRNWYNTDTYGKYVRRDQIDVVDRYNPDPFVIARQIDEAGGFEHYKGQVFYHSDQFGTYPLSMIDSVLESVQAEIESDKTTTNNLKNNFQLKGIFVLKGKVEDDDERLREISGVKEFIGSTAKPVMVIESEDVEGHDVPEWKSIDSKLDDKLFQYTDEKTRAKIYRRFNQPAILHSDLTQGRYNQNQLPESMKYYNNKTQNERNLMESVFKTIFENFKEPINPTNDYSIIPLEDLSPAIIATDNGNSPDNPTL